MRTETVAAEEGRQMRILCCDMLEAVMKSTKV